MQSTPVHLTDSFLISLQANILKSHGRNFAHHLFFRFKENSPEACKSWISQFAATRITSAKKQLEDTKLRHENKIADGGTVFTLSLSSTGYTKLDMASVLPTSASFREGMNARADFLKDDRIIWEEPFQDSIDLLVIVADDDSAVAKQQADNVITQTAEFAKLLLNQRGNVLKTAAGLGIEHFGYADGISQPLYLADEIDEQQNNKEWKDETGLNLLLIPDPGGKEPNDFGSFLVFRKLEQNVKGFKEKEDQLQIVKEASGNDNEELAGAMQVGRFENGMPVVKDSIGQPSNPPTITNDFGYTDDTLALKCPFHAHIRLMNPRNGDIVAGDLKEHRITRRGIPYDDVGRIREELITSVTDGLLEANQPETGVGLLFMCYQSQIENQFEILQSVWANKGIIGPHQLGMQDSIISQGTNPDKTLPLQWGEPAQTAPFSFHGFVTTRGGEYFFTPSITFLANLMEKADV